MKVNKVYEPYIKSKKRFNVLWGGRGSSKSHSIAQKKVIRISTFPYAKEIIVRKNFNTLKDSCYAKLQQIIYAEGLQSEFKFITSPLEITHIPTGNKFLFRGMANEDDRQKIKSIVDPTGAWIEEAQEFDKEDFTEINLIIRGKSEINKEIDLSFNPIDEELWLKDTFFDNPFSDEILTINTTYKDNLQFLDAVYVNELENLVRESDYYFTVYNEGKWGRIDTTGIIYKSFTEENKKAFKYKKQYPINVCCDFNVDPMKWALIQNVNGIDYVFDEIVQRDTNTERMVTELLEKYGNTEYHIYGDYSGTFRQTSSRSTDYEIIKQYLPAAQLHLKPNPMVIDRINAVNWRLCNKEKIRRLFVDPGCKNAVYSFERDTFKEGTRQEDKMLEKYDGKNPVLARIHITSAIGYYIEYNYGLKGKITSTVRRAF